MEKSLCFTSYFTSFSLFDQQAQWKNLRLATCGKISTFCQLEESILHLSCDEKTETHLRAQNAKVKMDGSSMDNLSCTQRVLLKLHFWLVHMNFLWIQQLACNGKLPKLIVNCNHLVCPTCQYRKGRCQSVMWMATAIDSAHLNPGECVSMDQLESNTPGKYQLWKESHLLAVM